MATHFFGSAFFGGEFFFAGTVVVVDTHDGARKRERWKKQKEERLLLREQIRRAIDGEAFLAPALERIAEPGPEPLAERVDIAELVAQVELWRSVRLAAEKWGAEQRAIDDDDEDVLLLI